LMNLVNTLKRLERIDFLPSNAMAGAKYALCNSEIDPLCQNCPTGKVPDFFHFIPLTPEQLHQPYVLNQTFVLP
ncbi:MAG: hypothetical protein J6U64_04550, partial [Alphaproteobacteria bacterium]|nr:hypothetical protein [Alphaproteobacteria bacterium]